MEGQAMGGGTGGAVLVGTNNAEKEVGQDTNMGTDWTFTVMGGKDQEYRNCRRMAINIEVQKVCEGCCSSWVRVCHGCRRGQRYCKLFKLDAQGKITEKTQRSINIQRNQLFRKMNLNVCA